MMLEKCRSRSRSSSLEKRVMIVLKDAYKTNTSIAKCIKKYNLPPFDINANLNAAKRINQQPNKSDVVAVVVAVAAVVVVVF